MSANPSLPCHVFAGSAGVFILQRCPVDDPDWKGLKVRKQTCKTVAEVASREEAERLVAAHNAPLFGSAIP